MQNIFEMLFLKDASRLKKTKSAVLNNDAGNERELPCQNQNFPKFLKDTPMQSDALSIWYLIDKILVELISRGIDDAAKQRARRVGPLTYK